MERIIDIDETHWKCPKCSTIHEEAFPYESDIPGQTVECVECGANLVVTPEEQPMSKIEKALEDIINAEEKSGYPRTSIVNGKLLTGRIGYMAKRANDALHFIRSDEFMMMRKDENWINADDVDRLVRDLDEALNGREGMAEQAKLCDIVAQVKSHRWIFIDISQLLTRISELLFYTRYPLFVNHHPGDFKEEAIYAYETDVRFRYGVDKIRDYITRKDVKNPILTEEKKEEGYPYIACPYCGVKDSHKVPYNGSCIVTCDRSEGGCGRKFSIAATAKTEYTIRKKAGRAVEKSTTMAQEVKDFLAKGNHEENTLKEGEASEERLKEDEKIPD